jgi:hypothetical protein
MPRPELKVETPESEFQASPKVWLLKLSLSFSDKLDTTVVLAVELYGAAFNKISFKESK